MRKLGAMIFVWLLLSCHSEETEKNKAALQDQQSIGKRYTVIADSNIVGLNNRPPADFYVSVKQQMHRIDSLREIVPDKLIDENLRLQQILEGYKEAIFNTKDTLNYELLYVVKSDDKKLCLFSWDTRMGGTMIDFATMAFFKTSGGQIHSKMLIDTSESPIGNTLMHYDRLYAVNNAGQLLYIAHGFGQGSTALPWQELRAFQVADSHLVNPKIFPGMKPNLFIEFDANKLGDRDIPVIRVADNGKEIIAPVQDDNEGFSGKYQKLIFQNGKYIVIE